MSTVHSNQMQSTVLSDMDWDDGFVIPVASMGNKKLETEVQTRNKILDATRAEAHIHEKRAQALHDHLTQVKQDLRNTVQLLAAKKRELNSDDHQKIIADREYGRLKQEIQRLKFNLKDNHETTVRVENKIYLANTRINELREDIAWDQKKLETWLEESSMQDDNVLTLHKYMKEDDSKLKQLMLTMDRLTEEVRVARNALDAERTETLTSQIEIDKTAEDFRKQQADREELIKQWKSTLDQMKRRDADIIQANEDTNNELSLLKDVKTTLSIKQSFFEEEQQNNVELEKKIEERTRQAGKLIDALQHQYAERDQVKNELQTTRFAVERVTTDLEQTKSNTSQLEKNHQVKIKKLEKIIEDRKRVQDQLKLVESQQLSEEQRIAASERILNHEESIVKNLSDQNKNARDMRFKKGQELKKNLHNEIVLRNTIVGEKSALKNLKSRLTQLDNLSLQQQETVYQQDYQLVNIERRIAKLQGEGMDQEEKEKLESKIKGLSEQLEAKVGQKKVVGQQLKKLGDEVRRVGREMEKTDKDYQDVQAKIAEMDLQYESSQRESTTLEKGNNSALVDDNLLRLELSRLRGGLAERVNSVVDLSQRRLQLNTAIKERKIHITNMKSMVNAEIKATEEERSVLSHDLHERITKIEKIRNRYESLMILMAPPEGESEESQSQAYYVIKAAQDKEELQRYGDKLDHDIKKAEAENDALINTVRLVKMKNKKMHEALSPAGTEFNEEAKELDKKAKSAQEKQKFRRNQFTDIQRQIQDLTEAITQAKGHEQAAAIQLTTTSHELEQIDRIIADQKVKLTRVGNSLGRYDRGRLNAHQNTDLDLREIRDLITGAGRQLQQVLKTQDEHVCSVAGTMLHQVGIDPESIISRSQSAIHSSKSSSLNSSCQASPRTPPHVELNVGGARPPSIASSRSTLTGSQRGSPRTKPSQRAPVTSPLASSRSSQASGLSITGSNPGSARSTTSSKR